jgi:hypothetical protein
MRHLITTIAAAAALMTAGCATAAAPGSTADKAGTGGPAAPRPASPPGSSVTHGALTVRLVLPSRVYVAGTTVTARIVIDNAGPPVHFTDCNDGFQVVLGNRHVHPDPVWPLCLRQDAIPFGESVRKVQVMATYTSCAPAPPYVTGLVRCLPGPKIPPLPAGTYQAQVIPVDSVLLPAPSPVTVQVVAPAG